MIRRSLFVFLGSVVLGLALTVVWAVFGLSGPAADIDKAERLLQQGSAAEVVRLLDTTEKSPGLQDQPQLRRRLLTIRLKAHQQRDMSQRALKDLDALTLLLTNPDEQLQLDRISLLGRLGRGDEALLDARKFVAAHPDHARGLELAGEAAHVAYRDKLRLTAAAVLRDLTGADAKAGSEARLHYLYRPEGDPGQISGLVRLQELYRKSASRQHAWPGLEPELRALRPRIQEGLQWCQRSLEAGGRPVAAWRSLSFALQQAGRLDDVVALGEIYLLRFDHVYAAEAAAAVAQAHLDSGLYAAALETGRRFLPSDSIKPRLQARQLDKGVQELINTGLTAAWQLNDRPALDALGNDIHVLLTASAIDHVPPHRYGALRGMLDGDHAAAEAHLKALCMLLGQDRAPPLGEDHLAEAMRLRLQVMQVRGASEGERNEVIDEWSKARPDSLEPLLARANLQLEFQRASAALGTTDEIQRRAPQDEQLLRLQARAAAAAYADSGQDGPGLVDQCLKRSTPVPDLPPRPVCYLLAADEALNRGVWPVAWECARTALEKFSWSRWPRLLQARALLLQGDTASAAQQLTQYLRLFPGDPEFLQLLLQARRERAEPLGDLLFDALVNCGPEPYIAELLLRTALDASDLRAAFALATAAARLPDPKPSLLALQARTFARMGHDADAAAALSRAFALTGDTASGALRADLLAAALAQLEGRAEAETDVALERSAQEYLQRCRTAGAGAYAELLRAAQLMAEQKRPRTALLLATAALDLHDGEQLRNGAAFVLAGRQALRTSQLSLATDLLTAAVSFPDGAAAAEDLARLYLLSGRRDKAAQVLRLVDDMASATLALGIGDREGALRLGRRALDEDPTALLPACVLGLLADAAEPGFGAELRAIEGDARTLLLQVLVRLQDPALAAGAVEGCEELSALHPDSPALRLLLARACLERQRPESTAALHGKLLAEGCRDHILLAESVRATARPGYLMPQQVHKAISELVFSRAKVPAVLRVHAVRSAALEAQRLGLPDHAAIMLSELWLSDPEAAQVRVHDVLFLVHRPAQQRAAMRLLDGLRTRVQGAELAACLDALFGTGDGMASSGDHGMAEALRVAALDTIRQHGPRAPAVWFLLRDDLRRQELDRSAAITEGEQARTWLEGALALCAEGVENTRWADRCLELLAERSGDEAAVAAATALLRKRPSLLPIWQKRAALLLRLQRPDEGLDALRHLLPYASDVDLVLGTVALAASSRSLQPADMAALATLPPAMLDRPAGRYAAGLVALRNGYGQLAEQLLAQVPPLPDGSHLYFRALANLIRRAPDAREQARALFQQLETDYRSSSLAKYAGSFARQLASP